MAIATISEIRQGLANRLKAAFPTGWNIQPYVLSNPVGPTMDVMPDRIQYDRAMQGKADTLWFIIRVTVPSAVDQGMQKNIDALLDPRSSTSIKAAVESDKTLGGKVSYAVVRECSGYKLYETGGAPVLGSEFSVEVMT